MSNVQTARIDPTYLPEQPHSERKLLDAFGSIEQRSVPATLTGKWMLAAGGHFLHYLVVDLVELAVNHEPMGESH